MVLSLKRFTNSEKKPAAEVLRTLKAAARAIYSIVILIPSPIRYGPTISTFAILASSRCNIQSISLFPHSSALIYFLSITSTVSIVHVRLLGKDFLYICLICTIKYLYNLLSRSDSVPKFRMSSLTRSSIWYSMVHKSESWCLLNVSINIHLNCFAFHPRPSSSFSLHARCLCLSTHQQQSCSSAFAPSSQDLSIWILYYYQSTLLQRENFG